MKRIFSIIVILSLAIITAFSLSITALAADSSVFPDVTPADWFYEDVTEFIASGVISGCPDGTFKPGDPMTRSGFTKVLICSLGYEQAPGNGFDDTADSWADIYISTAVSEGIIQIRVSVRL